MKILLLFALFGLSFSATVIDQSTCTTFPCLIFEDEFNTMDQNVWEHEISMTGGGNFEFQMYVNNRSNSYVNNSTLFIKPGLVSDWQGLSTVEGGSVSLWNMNGRNEICTSNLYDGCLKSASPEAVINPVKTARLRTLSDFAFKYGRVDVRAKMPKGDWLWPAVWLLPRYFPYGNWPASGEIDIIESKGNAPGGGYLENIDYNHVGTTLHWAPYSSLNRWFLTTGEIEGTFGDEFHIWTLNWTDTNMEFYIDEVHFLTIDPVTNFFDFANFQNDVGYLHNPWENKNKMTPFDQPFYLIVNLAVGGTNGFFPDGGNKPWGNGSPTAITDFWNARDSWLPTWGYDPATQEMSDDAAFQIDYIRVYKEDASQIET